jgi:hypothetical protein
LFWEKTVRLSSPLVNRVWVSREVKFVANIDAETFLQSEQWQTKVLTKPGAFNGCRGWRGNVCSVNINNMRSMRSELRIDWQTDWTDRSKVGGKHDSR